MYRNKHGASNSTMLCHGDHIKTNVCRYHIHTYIVCYPFMLDYRTFSLFFYCNIVVLHARYTRGRLQMYFILTVHCLCYL